MRRYAHVFIFFFLIGVAGSTARADWDDRFGHLGPAGEFNAPISNFWVEGSDLYVVGRFTTLDGMPADNVAKWDGTSWSTLGNPSFTSQNGIYAITGYQGNIVVAGEFTTVNGQPGDVAVWDGTTWSPLGNSPLYDGGNDDIVALQADGADLYIGGRFSELIARWDGVTTSTIVMSSTAPGGLAAPRVWDLTLWNGNLVAAGIFLTFDGVTLNYVGLWDGSQWEALGTGLPTTTDEAFVYDGDLYLQTRIDVFKWTGTEWVSVVPEPAGCEFGDHFAYDALFHEGHLYRTGASKNLSNDMLLWGVAKWTGGTWDDMHGGLIKNGSNAGCGGTGPLAEYDGHLVVGGDFDTAGGAPTSNLATWTGESWYTNSPSDRVRAILTSGPDVYAGGDLTAVGDIPANHVARWDGSAWSALGDGVEGIVYDMVMIAGDLYVGGEFTDAGGSGAQYLARWDGTDWSPVSSEFGGGPVYVLDTDGSNLFIGGSFFTYIQSQSLVLRNIARWDGSQWDALGGGMTNGSVRALATEGPHLYAGGDFTQVAGIITGNTVRWDGAAWTPLEGGFNGMVRSLELHAGELYAGGDFTDKFGSSDTFNHIGRWDGDAWQPVGSFPTVGTNQPVRDMSSGPGGLIVAGDFTTAGAIAANRVVQWDGAQWAAFGEGLNNSADAVTVGAGGNVWLGGQFGTAGTEGSVFFAHWMPDPTAVGDVTVPRGTMPLDAPYPNPFNPQTTIRYHTQEGVRVELVIFDVGGRRIRTLVDGVRTGVGPQSVNWDGRSDDGRPVASGVYYVRLRVNQQTYSRKLVLLK